MDPYMKHEGRGRRSIEFLSCYYICFLVVVYNVIVLVLINLLLIIINYYSASAIYLEC